MKVFEEPLEWKSFDELVENYQDMQVLLLDPMGDNDKPDGGYLKAVAWLGEQEIYRIAGQYQDRNHMIIEFSDISDRMMGIGPFSTDIYPDDFEEL